MQTRALLLLTISVAALAIVSACGGGDSLFAPTVGAGGASAGTAGSEPDASAQGGAGGTGQGGAPLVGGTAGTGGSTAGAGGSSQGGDSQGGASQGGASQGGSSQGGWSQGGAGGAPPLGGSAGTGGASGCAIDPPVAASQGSCVSMSAPGYGCNPVTNAGCSTASGEACDFNGTAFSCFPSPNNVPACGNCSSQGGPYCIGGFTCFGTTQRCTRYCCSNADCASGTWCVMQPPTSLGICQANSGNQLAGFKPGSGGSGGGGQGGSGGSAGACAHGPCVIGGPLDINCDACVGMVCALMASCCSTTWDSSCVQFAMLACACSP